MGTEWLQILSNSFGIDNKKSYQLINGTKLVINRINRNG